MTELLPCSKCRRVPQRVSRLRYPGDPRGEKGYDCGGGRACHPITWYAFDDSARKEWNIRCGSPLTLAERPQDVPACDADGALEVQTSLIESQLKAYDLPTLDEPSVGDGVRVVAGTPAWRRANREAYAAMWAELHAPTATCDGKRWRGCGDALARWSVMSCSGGG